MNITYAMQRLRDDGAAIEALVRGVGEEQARWKPSADEWSILEVVNHLFDEEREDFRLRLDLTLHHPDQEWPPIHPSAWVTEREYNSRDLAESAANFAAERATSLAWLGELRQPAWDKSRQHPSGFSISAADFLAAWVAHDLLHLRQLAQLHYQYAARVFHPASLDYAGDW